MVRVAFCHGLESGPHGRKFQALAAAGFDVVSPDYRGMNLQQRVELLEPILLGDTPPAIVVGSSYGGLVALCAAIRAADAGRAPGSLVLCAPALGRREPPADSLELVAPVPTIVVHGTRDSICPIELSRQFAERSGLARLFEVDDEHRLIDSLDTIVDAVRDLA